MLLALFVNLSVHLITQKVLNGFPSNLHQGCVFGEETNRLNFGHHPHYDRITWISMPGKILFQSMCKKTIYDFIVSQLYIRMNIINFGAGL